MPFRNERLTLNMNTPALTTSEGHCRCRRRLPAVSSRLLEAASGLRSTKTSAAAVEQETCLQDSARLIHESLFNWRGT